MTVFTEILTAINASPKFNEVESILNDFGIKIDEGKKNSKRHLINDNGIPIKFTNTKLERVYHIKTSHKAAKMINLDSSLTFNFDFLTFENCRIDTKYQVNDVIQKIIDYGNQYVDFFEALRIKDLLTHKLYNYAEAVKPYIDFDFNRDDPNQHEIILNFEHTKSNMCSLVSNNMDISSGSHQSMYIVFNLKGEMKVNRVNVSRKRTLAAWEDNIGKSFKEYGLLTDMISM